MNNIQNNTLEIGDFYCRDGFFHKKEDMLDKDSVIGIVFSTSLTKEELEGGFKAYILSLTDLSVNGIDTFAWRKDYQTVNCEDIKISYNELEYRLVDLLHCQKFEVKKQQESAIDNGFINYDAICRTSEHCVNLPSDSIRWFIPGCTHWNLIIKNLLHSDVKFNDNGFAGFYNETEIFEETKNMLKLSGQYWMYPSTFDSRRLYFIDFNSHYLDHLKASDGKGMKVRPIALV